MAKGRILVVEDDTDTAEVLRVLFDDDGYTVHVVNRGTDVFEATRSRFPDLIILDILLPGMDGYEVCRQLRTTARTSHIPIIFLTQKDTRNDRLAGLELGADDYITKPFDLDELKLRAKNAIVSHQRMNMTDPRTGLPAARLIEEQLRALMPAPVWTYTELSVIGLQHFIDTYGFVAGDEVLRFAALTIGEMVDSGGTDDDFIGQASAETFILITYTDEAERMIEQIRARFDEAIVAHYNFQDSERGGIPQPDGSLAPMMQLAIGTVSDQDGPFADIREITEAAVAARQANSVH